MKFLTIILVAFAISNAGNVKIHSESAIRARGGFPVVTYTTMNDSTMLRVTYKKPNEEMVIIYCTRLMDIRMGAKRSQLRYFAPWHEKTYRIKGKKINGVQYYDITDMDLDIELVNYTQQHFDSKKGGK